MGAQRKVRGYCEVIGAWTRQLVEEVVRNGLSTDLFQRWTRHRFLMGWVWGGKSRWKAKTVPIFQA